MNSPLPSGLCPIENLLDLTASLLVLSITTLNRLITKIMIKKIYKDSNEYEHSHSFNQPKA